MNDELRSILKQEMMVKARYVLSLNLTRAMEYLVHWPRSKADISLIQVYSANAKLTRFMFSGYIYSQIELWIIKR